MAELKIDDSIAPSCVYISASDKVQELADTVYGIAALNHT